MMAHHVPVAGTGRPSRCLEGLRESWKELWFLCSGTGNDTTGKAAGEAQTDGVFVATTGAGRRASTGSVVDGEEGIVQWSGG